MSFYVYILASRKNGTIYIGMTDDLAKRIWMHRTGVLAGFTKRYGVKNLVWYEQHASRESAFMREQQLKKWKRAGSWSLLRRLIQLGGICMKTCCCKELGPRFRGDERRG